MPQTYGKKMASRYGYGEALVMLGQRDRRIVAVGADVTGSTGVDKFAERFPDRFFQLGIAEQNCITVAAGLAVSGQIPFVCAYSVFVTGRTWEQIRTSICYPNTNVKIAGSHSGVTVGPDGATHQATEDIAIMRALPNMRVVVPCDYEEAKQATLCIAEIEGPVFIRLCRVPMPTITPAEAPFTFGQARQLRDGTDVCIVACGSMVYEALLAAETLATEGVHARVLNMHTIKPIDANALVRAATECAAIVTAEEHQITSGLGGAVAETLARTVPVPIEMVGMNDCFGESGEPEELLAHFHLKAVDIQAAVARAIARKRGRRP